MAVPCVRRAVRTVQVPLRARFHLLRVADVRRETPDAISVAFAVPEGLRGAYAFRAGQYLTLRVEVGGEAVRRTYSICSGEDEGELRIAIRRLEGGVFSVWAMEALRPGMALEVMTPIGRFGAAIRPDEARVHVGFAAGSGITPVLSVMKTLLAREKLSRFFLFYGSRTSRHVLFREELEDLKDRYLDRVSVLHVLSRERQDIEVLNGRLEGEKLRGLLGPMLGGCGVDEAYVCGPFGMIETVCALLAESGVPAERVHVERFTSALEGRPQVTAPVAVSVSDEPAFAVATIVSGGVRTAVPVRRDEAVLDAALRAGLDLPFACKGGMCCTCRARLVEGEAKMAVNYSLEAWEMAAGFVLTCQARAVSRRLVVDYDVV